MNIRLLAPLTALALLTPAQAASTPKLTGTLLMFTMGNGQFCTSYYIAFRLASNEVDRPQRDALSTEGESDEDVKCPLELATSASGIFIASDAVQADKGGYWDAAGTNGQFDNLRQVRQDNYFTDILISAPPNQPLKRIEPLKAIKDAQGKKLLRSGLALSRDGSRLAFNSSTEKNYLNNINGSSVLVRTLKGDLLGTLKASSDPAWMPDGRLLVVCTHPTADALGSALCIHDLQAKTVEKLPPPPQSAYIAPTVAKIDIDRSATFEFSQPAVSPDGKRVAVTLSPICYGCAGDYDLPMSQVWILDIQSRKWSPALEWAPELRAVSSVAAPVWSPDGKFLAVSINSYLAFIDLAAHKLTGYSNAAYGQKVIVRPVWIK